ncbi:pseudouridine synthase [Phenylobacterium sp.]|uniref:pseudouridine synthase n=1 Tax=Phenylobacterium sp. TaxID=1871053 RepID=UPI0039C9BC22
MRGLKGDAHGAKIMVHDPHRTGGRPSGQARTPQAPGTPEVGGDRVAKLLARAGVASRREVERLIEAGRVALNGKVLTTPAVKVEAGDILTVDGAVVTEAEPARLFRYHKPVDLVTSHKDPQGRPTVFERLPAGLPRLISVGRLDINSEGLLLLTNDGGLARALEMPATGVVRRYRARARGRVTQERLDTLKKGITVEGVHYGSIDATLDKAKEGPQGANLWITVVLAEGKNREVRRVLEALGLKVNRLIRLSYGPFALGTLMPGEVEEVGPRVIREQLAQHIAPQNLPKGDRALWKKPAVAAAGPRRGAVEIDRGGKPTRSGKDHRRARGPSPTGEAPQKKEYKPGWAKPKPRPVIAAKAPGSKRAGGPNAGPRGPKPSASPPRSSGARRPGPPRSGGPKPRA